MAWQKRRFLDLAVSLSDMNLISHAPNARERNMPAWKQCYDLSLSHPFDISYAPAIGADHFHPSLNPSLLREHGRFLRRWFQSKNPLTDEVTSL
jgi:hypothetical protein